MRPPADETFKVGCYELSFHWTHVNAYRVRENRAKSKAHMSGLTSTTLSLINRAYIHRGRMMLFRLPFKSWRDCAKIGKGLRRSREA